MPTVAESWHVFMIRKVLLTNEFVGYTFDMMNMRAPLLRTAASSALYVGLVSLLDEAIEARMSPEDYERGKRTKSRLEMLNKAGDLINFPALEGINRRRNEIAHEFESGGTIAELESAVENVSAQLVAWGMIQNAGPYTLEAERSAMYDTGDSEWPWAQDMIVRVMRAGKRYAEMKSARRIAKD